MTFFLLLNIFLALCVVCVCVRAANRSSSKAVQTGSSPSGGGGGTDAEDTQFDRASDILSRLGSTRVGKGGKLIRDREIMVADGEINLDVDTGEMGTQTGEEESVERKVGVGGYNRDEVAVRPLEQVAEGVGEEEEEQRPEHAEPLSDQQEQLYQQHIEAIGLDIITRSYSKYSYFRESALIDLYDLMLNLDKSSGKSKARDLLRTATFILERLLKDLVIGVQAGAQKVLRMSLQDYIPDHKLSQGDVKVLVSATLPSLLSRTADTMNTVKQREDAENFIVEMAQMPNVKKTGLVPEHLLQEFPPNAPPRQATSQLEMLEHLIDKLKLDLESKSGVKVDNVMKCCMCGINHQHPEVRSSAQRIIMSLYKLEKYKKKVRSHFPADTPASRKAPKLKKVFEEFDKIDGKISPQEAKRLKEEEKKRKAQEVRALQQQAASLRQEIEKAKGNKKTKSPDADSNVKPSEQAKPKATNMKITSDGQDITVHIDIDNDEDDVGNVKSTPPPAKHTQQIRAKRISRMSSNGSGEDDKTCVFCGERSAAFNEEKLDEHYWKECPMLTRCQNCKKDGNVVEIASYSQHLLEECEAKDEYKKCPRCGLAIKEDVLDTHLEGQTCPDVSGVTGVTCPACEELVGEGEEVWKTHLMGEDENSGNCKNNPRRAAWISNKREQQAKRARTATKARGSVINGAAGGGGGRVGKTGGGGARGAKGGGRGGAVKPGAVGRGRGARPVGGANTKQQPGAGRDTQRGGGANRGRGRAKSNDFNAKYRMYR